MTDVTQQASMPCSSYSPSQDHHAAPNGPENPLAATPRGTKVYHCGCCNPRVEWTGLNACHCSACGLTFGGLSGFDMHQVGGRCRSRVELEAHGLHEVRPGVLGRRYPGRIAADDAA